jgi:lysylphosphatidylglycerol synthetase-like protein (DUF2156 family)
VWKGEPGVRRLVATDADGGVVGFAFYDPMYDHGRVVGYAANIVRCDERRFGKLIPALHMEAMELFRPEGVQVLNLALSPFVKLHQARFNDDRLTRWLFRLSERFGNDIYNFRGLSFHKSKYRGSEKHMYYATNRVLPAVDIYLAFRAADILENYFATTRQIWSAALRGARAGKSPSGNPPK